MFIFYLNGQCLTRELIFVTGGGLFLFYQPTIAEAPQDYMIESKWTDIFTHLWSYEFTADFVHTYFLSGRGKGSFIDSILAKPMHTIQQKNAFRKELAPVAWIVSSCKAKNGRHIYIKQLLKHIKVDIYGRCMKNKNWPVHPGNKKHIYHLIYNAISSLTLLNDGTKSTLLLNFLLLKMDGSIPTWR